MAVDESRRTLLSYWWVLPVAGTAGAFAYMANYARRVTLDKRAPGAPAFVRGQRVRVAALTELSPPLSEREFVYEGRPCLLLELPEAGPGSLSVPGAGGARHFAAYSRVCTHQGCSVNLIRDPELLALSYNYRTDRPMLGCPCHYSVFDPQAGGASVFGRALFALPRVELARQGGAIYALGIEPAPGLQG